METTKTRYHINNSYIDEPILFNDFFLIQIGRRYCSAGEVIAMHPHLNWYELTIVTHGEGDIFTNGVPAHVKTGDIYLSFPCDLHELRASEHNPFEYDFLSFYTQDENVADILSKITQAYREVKQRIFRDEKIGYLVGNAILEFSIEKLYKKNLLSSIFEQILIYLLRDFNLHGNDTANVSSSDILCFQIMNYIDTHLYEIHNLESIAPLFNYNYSYLSSLFKRTTGKTIFDYYNHRRLESAKAFILEKKKKIGEIADLLNYSSVFSFSKAFKTKYKISPKYMQKTEKDGR